MTPHLKGILLAYLACISMGIGITVVQVTPVNEAALVFYRCLLAAPAMYLITRWRKISFRIEPAERLATLSIAVLTGAHWISLFISIKLGTVALAMVSFYTFPVFSTLLEAAVQRRKPRSVDLLLAAVTVGGVILLTPLAGAPKELLLPVLVGIGSALFWSGRIVLLHRRMRPYDSGVVMFWNLLLIAALLLPVALTQESPLTWEAMTWLKLLFLGFFVTAFCHTLVLMSLRQISATLFSQIGPVQILFAALAGWWFLGEPLTGRLIFGGLVICVAGFLASFSHRKVDELGP